MKFLLINSPIYPERSENKEEYLPPLGLAYIATHLEEAGISVKLTDCVKERIGVKDVVKLLQKEKPKYVGINIFSQNYEIVKNIVENCPVSSVIIIGGQVVKNIYTDILKWSVSNDLILIIGEGELILPAIVAGNCMEKPFYSDGHKLVYKVNNESCYFPAQLGAVKLNRSFLKDEIIENHFAEKEAAIITSRGCIYNCAFCGGAHSLNHDVSIRIREPEDIIDEITNISSSCPEVTCIRVLDDLFLRNSKSIIDAACIFGQFPKLHWRGMAHVLSFSKSIELLPLLVESGCKELFIGIESGSERLRRKINKVGTVEQIIEVISAILNIGINVKGYFIYGFPTEDPCDFNSTYELAKKLCEISAETPGAFRCSVFQFRPYHGTQLYNEILSQGYTIKPITSNMVISKVTGRSQFNFQSGNYSEVSDDTLANFILKTQQLSE